MIKDITPEALTDQKAMIDDKNSPKEGGFEFNEKKYFNPVVKDGEKETQYSIRLLPWSETENSPFHLIHCHTLQVPVVDFETKTKSKKWRTFMCPTHTDNKPCPFCETSKQAYEERKAATDEAIKKELGTIGFDNLAKDYWIVRCIVRGAENDGIKYWRFASSRKGDGIYDKIYSLFKNLQAEGMNLFSLYEGYDIKITAKKDQNNKRVYMISNAMKPSPITTDEKQLEEWYYQPTNMNEIYPTQPYEKLAIYLQGKIPVFSKELNKFVAEDAYQILKEEAKNEELAEKLSASQDFSETVQTFGTDSNNSITVKEVGGNAVLNPATVPSSPVIPTLEPTPIVNVGVTDEVSDDDLPF